MTEDQATALWSALCARTRTEKIREPSLSAIDMAQFRRAIAAKSGRRLSCTADAVSLAEARAIWDVASALAAAAEPRPANPLRAKAGAAAVLAASLPLAACATLLGGNVKGNFTCSAPGGTCAPSTVIDDNALNLIQNARPMSPASQPWSRPPMRGDGKVVAVSNGIAHRERRVLKVVFPAFVDQRGYLHEARVVHAVADQGGWMQVADAEAGLPAMAYASTQGTAAGGTGATGSAEPNAKSVERKSPSLAKESAALPGADSMLPDPAKVAAARARAKPLLPTTPSEIKAAVVATLAPQPLKADAMPGGSQNEKLDSGGASQATTSASDVNGKGPQTSQPSPTHEERPAVTNGPAIFPGRVDE
jgi:conjugal transfer pilus assembly protein TraV